MGPESNKVDTTPFQKGSWLSHRDSDLFQLELVFIPEEVVKDGGDRQVKYEAHLDALEPFVVDLHADYVRRQQKETEAHHDLHCNFLNVPEGQLVAPVLAAHPDVIVTPVLHHKRQEGAEEENPHASQEAAPNNRCNPRKVLQEEFLGALIEN